MPEPDHRDTVRCMTNDPAPATQRPANAVRALPPRIIAMLVLVAGWFLVAIAISLLIRLELGVAPYDVLNVGLGERIGVAPGTAMWITGTILVLLAWILGQRPGPATPLGFLTIGFFINLTLPLVPETSGLALRVALLVPALLLLYQGVCLIIVSGLGAGPTEVLMLALSERGLGLKVSRWLIELGCAGVGYLLGGPVGVLTVLLVALAAPIISLLLPLNTRLLAPVVTGNRGASDAASPNVD